MLIPALPSQSTTVSRIAIVIIIFRNKIQQPRCPLLHPYPFPSTTLLTSKLVTTSSMPSIAPSSASIQPTPGCSTLPCSPTQHSTFLATSWRASPLSTQSVLIKFQSWILRTSSATSELVWSRGTRTKPRLRRRRSRSIIALEKETWMIRRDYWVGPSITVTLREMWLVMDYGSLGTGW